MESLANVHTKVLKINMKLKKSIISKDILIFLFVFIYFKYFNENSSCFFNHFLERTAPLTSSSAKYITTFSKII